MTRFGNLCLATMVAGLIGCGDQMMTDEYQGESLLRVRGSVVIPLELQGATFEPAIGWWSVPTGVAAGFPYLRITRVDVQGNFPANFTLDVYDPPPQESLLREAGTGEPFYAEGFITAVAPYYPPAVNFDWWPNGCGDGCHLHSICEGTNHPISPEADRSQCYQQEFLCDPERVTSPDESGCQLQGVGGDPSLAFGGVSNDFRIVYFSEAIAGDTVLADRFNDAEPIAAGYHVYRLAPLPPSVIESAEDYVPSEAEKCWQRAVTMAFTRYNTEHGTNFTEDTWSPEPYGTEYYNFERTILKVKREIGCARPERSYLPVDLATDPIAIQLGLVDIMQAGF